MSHRDVLIKSSVELNASDSLWTRNDTTRLSYSELSVPINSRELAKLPSLQFIRKKSPDKYVNNEANLLFL